MTEQQRQYYLQALGIESYVPRWILPGAAESPVYDLSVVDELVEDFATLPSAPTPAEAGAESQPGTAAKSRLPGELLGQPRKERENRRAPTAPVHAPVQHRFALSAWRILDNVMVLDSRQVKLAFPVEPLLLNISTALGYEGAALPQAKLLRWPALGTATLPRGGVEQSVAEARAMVRAYLAGQHEKQAFDTVLLMGQDALRHGLNAGDLEPGDDLRKLLGRQFSLSLMEESLIEESLAEGQQPGTVQAIALPSLAAMLRTPSLKALTWKAIKHLRSGR